MFTNATCVFCKQQSLLTTNRRHAEWEYNLLKPKKENKRIWFHRSCYLKYCAEERQKRAERSYNET